MTTLHTRKDTLVCPEWKLCIDKLVFLFIATLRRHATVLSLNAITC